MAETPKKPVVTARERSPYGDITPEELANLTGQGRDRWYIDGYSDKRTQRELDIREGRKASSLTHRFHLVPVTGIDGKSLAKGVSEKRQQGYRPVMATDLKGLGISLDNGAYEVMPDGTIRNGDCILMVTDAKHAAANYIAQERRNQAAMDAPKARMEKAAEDFNAKMGLTSKTGTAPIFEISEGDA